MGAPPWCSFSIAMAESKVKDMGLAEFGRKELSLAEHEMPGLMAARKEFGPAQPFKGLNINGSLHMTIQTSSGPIHLPGWPWHYHARIWPLVQPRLCHRASILCYVLLVHQPGPWPVGSLEKLEGRQRLQERCVLVAERVG